MPPSGRVLVIGGSDSGGGAGIQGDIKTITALGGYAMSAVTALTAQNTMGVFAVHEVPGPFIADQIRVVLEDIGADAIKIGMLHKAHAIDAVGDALIPFPDIPVILDPVMVAKGGASLLDPKAVEVLKGRLFPRALLITPNVPEAEALLKMPAGSLKELSQMQAASQALLQFRSQGVLIKGGHRDSRTVTDVLAVKGPDGPDSIGFSSRRIHTLHTHGTGCALASAIATFIAQGRGLEEAIRSARAYVQEAIRTAPELGGGHGPLNHLIKVP